MPQVSIHRSFTNSLLTFPQEIQRQTWDLVHQIGENPDLPGINFERVKGAVDSHVYSARVNEDVRAIILKPKKENVFLFTYVDHHDKAYRWAERRRFEVNRYTGTFQTYVDSDATISESSPNLLFGKYTADQLLQIGVPRKLLPAVFSVKDREDLDEWIEEIPEDARYALECLINHDDYEEVLEFVTSIRKKPSAKVSYLDAFLNTPEQVKVITSDQQLREILDSPLDQWRLYLHPSQRELVEKDFSGSVRVLGGAGTGKTVVALHRAKQLLTQLLGAQDRLLVTTFTHNLTDILGIQLAEFLNHDEELLQRVDILCVDDLAHRICVEEVGLTIHRLMKDADRDTIWQQTKSALQLEPELYELARQEYEKVILEEGIETLDEYLQVLRRGRKNKLGKAARKQVWAVVEAVRSVMKERGWVEYADRIRIARKWLEENPHRVEYRAAIVDEVQDFSSEGLKLIRALVPKNRNDLFIVGDPHQRIYPRFVILSRCGIEIRGARSQRLRVNYRTTEQIRRQAMKVIQEIEFDDLDGGKNVIDDISLLTGTQPIYQTYKEFKEERTYIYEEIQKLLQSGYQPHEIAIFARTNKMVEKYAMYLEKKQLKVHRLDQQSHLGAQGILCGTIHRSKGLEFRVVWVVGMDDAHFPFRYVLNQKQTEEERTIFLNQERSLFYVACTRAREKLYITSSGEPSVWLGE